MSLNESTAEAAAFEWVEELGYAVGCGATFAKLRRAKLHLSSLASRPVGWLAARPVHRSDCG
jgi:hypothetical protein